LSLMLTERNLHDLKFAGTVTCGTSDDRLEGCAVHATHSLKAEKIQEAVTRSTAFSEPRPAVVGRPVQAFASLCQYKLSALPRDVSAR